MLKLEFNKLIGSCQGKSFLEDVQRTWEIAPIRIIDIESILN